MECWITLKYYPCYNKWKSLSDQYYYIIYNAAYTAVSQTADPFTTLIPPHLTENIKVLVLPRLTKLFGNTKWNHKCTGDSTTVNRTIQVTMGSRGFDHSVCAPCGLRNEYFSWFSKRKQRCSRWLYTDVRTARVHFHSGASSWTGPWSSLYNLDKDSFHPYLVVAPRPPHSSSTSSSAVGSNLVGIRKHSNLEAGTLMGSEGS